MDLYCKRHPSRTCYWFCKECRQFLCDVCQHPQYEHETIRISQLTDSIQLVIDTLANYSLIEERKIQQIGALELLARHPELSDDLEVRRLKREVSDQDYYLKESVQLKMINKRHPNPGMHEKLVQYCFWQGGDQVTIGDDVKLCYEHAFDAHTQLKNCIQQHFTRKRQMFDVDDGIQHPARTFGGEEIADSSADYVKKILTYKATPQLKVLLQNVRRACGAENYQSALDNLEQINELLGGLTEQMLKIKAKLLSKIGSHNLALDIYRVIPPKNPKEQFQWALEEFNYNNQSKKAKQAVEELLQRHPPKYEYYVLLGDIYLAKRDYYSSQENYQKARSFRESGLVDARLANLIIQQVNSSEYSEAKRLLNSAIQQNPKNRILYANRAYLHNKTGQKDEAFRDYSKSLQLGYHPIIENNLAVLTYWNKSVKSAKETLMNLATDKEIVQIVVNYIEVLLREQQQVTDVFKKVRVLREKWGSTPQFMYVEAKVLYKLDDKQEMRSYLKRLRSYCKEHQWNKPMVQLFCKCAAECEDLNMVKEAESKLIWYLQKDKGSLTTVAHANLMNTMGFVQLRLNQIGKSREYFYGAVALQQTDRYCYNYAFALYLNKDYDTALTSINKAISKSFNIVKYEMLKLKIILAQGNFHYADGFIDRMLIKYKENREITPFLKALKQNIRY